MEALLIASLLHGNIPMLKAVSIWELMYCTENLDQETYSVRMADFEEAMVNGNVPGMLVWMKSSKLVLRPQVSLRFIASGLLRSYFMGLEGARTLLTVIKPAKINVMRH
jgi:hypothetical protein